MHYGIMIIIQHVIIIILLSGHTSNSDDNPNSYKPIPEFHSSAAAGTATKINNNCSYVIIFSYESQ